ncbi:MAG: smalltalk protein [Prevotella sp.]|nr:smalltalk protein [Prevotella sp.]
MKTDWKKILKLIITLLTALLTAAGGTAAITSCMG